MVFTVYVDGAEMAHITTSRLRELCAQHDVHAEVAVVDVGADPQAAEDGNVVGVPTVVREQPRPRRRVIGALDDARRVSEALGLDMVPADGEGADR
jgi:hypothetical protein